MKQKTKIFKIILLIVVIAIMAITTVYLIPTFKELSNEAGQQAFKQKINESGFMGFLMLFGLQFAQIFLFIIPGEPIEILAGLCYGGLCGTVFIMISAAIISAFIYLLVHKLGREFIYEFVKPEKIECQLFAKILMPTCPKPNKKMITASFLPQKFWLKVSTCTVLM